MLWSKKEINEGYKLLQFAIFQVCAYKINKVNKFICNVTLHTYLVQNLILFYQTQMIEATESLTFLILNFLGTLHE